MLAVAVLLVPSVPGQQRTARPRPTAAPTQVTPHAPALPPVPQRTGKDPLKYDQDRLLAGHLLRRIGFGPNKTEMKKVLKSGYTKYLDKQLNPAKINDSAAESLLNFRPDGEFDAYTRVRKWYVRMTYSRRQLQEKMTLLWHEHFATSVAKVGWANLMEQQEELFRRNSLGSFRTMCVEITKDPAMLLWLDNDRNNGNAFDDQGNRIPPNENYARELLQLFTTGTVLINMDGTPVIGADGQPVPAYTEMDVRETARALTGFYVDYRREGLTVKFAPEYHDSGNKTILGETVIGRSGADGAREVEDVVNVIMRHPSTAPFIAKTLIQKLATETPTPGYVARVAAVFKQTNGDIKATVRTLVLDPEFRSEEVVLTQYKTPIEAFVGATRGLGGSTQGHALTQWAYLGKHLVYFPPSVFSFYLPGQKGGLVNTSLLLLRDTASDQLVSGHYDTYFDAAALIRANKIRSPEQAVDYLSDALLAAPLQPEVRDEVLLYMGGSISEEKFRGATWLILCSPDFQRN
jgi:uncharacterized protein (DUF1800 family)